MTQPTKEPTRCPQAPGGLSFPRVSGLHWHLPLKTEGEASAGIARGCLVSSPSAVHLIEVYPETTTTTRKRKISLQGGQSHRDQEQQRICSVLCICPSRPALLSVSQVCSLPGKAGQESLETFWRGKLVRHLQRQSSLRVSKQRPPALGLVFDFPSLGRELPWYQ